MKKLISLFLFLGFTIVFAQNISNYEYVFVPKKFKDFEINQYDLNKQLTKVLTDKKYKIIQDELLADCNVLKADLLNNSNMFRNKVILQFINCRGDVILESKATSMLKEFDLGFQDALKTSLATVPASMPNPNLISSSLKEKIKEDVPKPINQMEITELKKEPSFTTSDSKKAESYSNGKINLQKIQISKDQFILVSSISSVPFATFKNTTKADVYRVTLENGTSTIGYTENGNLVIEIPLTDGNFKKETFMAK